MARGGFFESAEVLDLLSLLQLLDNPLQDVPCIAVLRSPLVGLSLAIVGLGGSAPPFDASVRMVVLGIAGLVALSSFAELSPR